MLPHKSEQRFGPSGSARGFACANISRITVYSLPKAAYLSPARKRDFMGRIFLTIAAILCLGTYSVCQSPSAAGATFTKDVAPILQKHCQTCHRPGEAAPFPLLTYEQARPWATSMKRVVKQKVMPPWFADPAIGHFSMTGRSTIRKSAPSSRGQMPARPKEKLRICRSPRHSPKDGAFLSLMRFSNCRRPIPFLLRAWWNIST